MISHNEEDASIVPIGMQYKTQTLNNFVKILLVFLPSYLFACSLIFVTGFICFTLFQTHGVFKDLGMKFQSRH